MTLKGRGGAVDEAQFGGESQEAFLSRIRARLRGGGYVADHPNVPAGPWEDEELASYEEKAERFRKALVELGGEVYRTPSREEAFQLVRDLLLRRDVKGVLTSGGDWSQCRAILGQAGIAVESWDEVAFSHGEADRELARADRWGAGLLWADYAVAELGSIAVLSSPRQGRSVSLVPPLMIALIAPQALVERRRTVLRRVAALSKERGIPPSLTLITGPSRSADIENDLSIGVHGPGQVIAILVEGS
ncbi:MAG TPA: lactate utilization protein [Limnochordia bacterium]|nr:lactate utilization protein [Limnochordia bacterium]